MPPRPPMLPGRWHTAGPPIDVYAHGEETPTRVAILSGGSLNGSGMLALFAEAGRPSPVDPSATYRVQIEQLDARRSAAAGTDVPYDPPRRRVTMLRSDQMGGTLASYAPRDAEKSPVVFDPGALYRVTIERVEPTS
jgi:hypothetical protein